TKRRTASGWSRTTATWSRSSWIRTRTHASSASWSASCGSAEGLSRQAPGAGGLARPEREGSIPEDLRRTDWQSVRTSERIGNPSYEGLAGRLLSRQRQEHGPEGIQYHQVGPLITAGRFPRLPPPGPVSPPPPRP